MKNDTFTRTTSAVILALFIGLDLLALYAIIVKCAWWQILTLFISLSVTLSFADELAKGRKQDDDRREPL